ncbi:hypothetical protein PF011_g22785 [Phytophthora fragariae]|uniref:Uncharacterized protein n=1 Tax=Phytophthora fragariae TaxID=53985 RepID=A0A6A3IDM9_9STRA|nr:hypothetical protein PF011_g22785 [Phytophthora fragariae]
MVTSTSRTRWYPNQNKVVHTLCRHDGLRHGDGQRSASCAALESLPARSSHVHYPNTPLSSSDLTPETVFFLCEHKLGVAFAAGIQLASIRGPIDELWLAIRLFESVSEDDFRLFFDQQTEICSRLAEQMPRSSWRYVVQRLLQQAISDSTSVDQVPVDNGVTFRVRGIISHTKPVTVEPAALAVSWNEYFNELKSGSMD